MSATRNRPFSQDERGVSSTLQAVILVALVTVTVSAIGYAVLGVVLVDDSPEVERVKFHVSGTGLTVTPMVADPLPADDVEVRIAHTRRDRTSVTIQDVARASMAADAGRYVEVGGHGSAASSAPVATVQSDLGADGETPARASWAAGQPLHVETRSGFVRQGDVLTIQVLDREHQTLLVEKDLRVTGLPKTIIHDVDPSPGDGGDPVPPDAGGRKSSVNRSETGGVIDLGRRWDRSVRQPGGRLRTNPAAGQPDDGSTGGAGGESGAGGGTCSAGCDFGGIDIPDSELPGGIGAGGGGGGDGSGPVDLAEVSQVGGGSGGSMDTIGDSIDASQSPETMITNGDGGAVRIGDGTGEKVTAITESAFELTSGQETGTVSLEEFGQEAQNRVASTLQNANSPEITTTYHGVSANGAGSGGSGGGESGFDIGGSSGGSGGGSTIDLPPINPGGLI